MKVFLIIASLCGCSDPMCSVHVDCSDPYMTGAGCCLSDGRMGMCVLGECSPGESGSGSDESVEEEEY